MAIEKRGKGYRASYKDAAGKYRWTPVHPTKKLAQQAAEDEASKVRRGTWLDPSGGKITFSQYFEEQWFPNRRGELNTKKAYWSHYSSTLKAEFGDLPLSAIRYSTVQGWVTRESNAGATPGTIMAKFKTLQTVLAGKKGASAIRDGLIAANPCHGVDVDTPEKREVQIYEPDEVEDLLGEIPKAYRLLPLLASETGLRWGELMGLRVKRFGVGYRTVTVRETILEVKIEETGNGTPYMWKAYPKGKQTRHVKLSKEAATVVEKYIRKMGLGADDRLFSMIDKDGQPVRTDEWPEGLPIGRSFFREQIWKPANQAAGLEPRRFHDLRASYISWLLAGGADLPTVMKQVGHTEFETTQRYTKPMDDAADRALDALKATKRRYKSAGNVTKLPRRKEA